MELITDKLSPVELNLENKEIQCSETAGKIRDILGKEWAKSGSTVAFQQKEFVQKDTIIWQASGGSFPKRIAKQFKKVYGADLPDEAKEVIGNLTRSTIPATGVYFMDLTENVNWKSGEFGDMGSCFYHGSGSWDTPPDSIAMRLWKQIPNSTKNRNLFSYRRTKPYDDSDFLYIGYARAWVVENVYLRSEDEKKIASVPPSENPRVFASVSAFTCDTVGTNNKVVANPYGASSYTMGEILATKLGGRTFPIEYFDCDFYLNGNPKLVYIPKKINQQ